MFGPRIVVFEVVIMLSWYLLVVVVFSFLLFYGFHCVRVLCLKRCFCCHVVWCCFHYFMALIV